MMEAIVQGHEHLSNFLSTVRIALENGQQYRHFHAFVVSLVIYLGSQNLAGLGQAIPDGKSAGGLY